MPSLPYRAVVFLDLDGTLLDEHHRAGAAALELLSHLRRSDVLPVLATARSTWEVTDLLGPHAAETGILSSGCLVCSQGKLLSRHTLAPELLSQVVHVAAERGDELGFFTEHGYAVTGRSPTVDADMSALGEPLERVTVDPTIWQREPISYICLYSPTSDATPYRRRFSTHLTLTPYSATGFTGLPAGVSKAAGARELLAADPRATGATTVAFGDERNDCALVAQADLGVAMPNSRPELLAVADEVAPTVGPQGITAVLAAHGVLSHGA